MEYKEKKIIMLAIKGKARIWSNIFKEPMLVCYEYDQMAGSPGQAFHLYVLSDEKIEVGNWVKLAIGDIRQMTDKNMIDYLSSDSLATKIIATTDRSLGLPNIDINFIKKYIRLFNAKINVKKVLVGYENENIKIGYQNYISIKTANDTWTREEVEGLCEDAYNTGYKNKEEFQFDKWKFKNL